MKDETHKHRTQRGMSRKKARNKEEREQII